MAVSGRAITYLVKVLIVPCSGPIWALGRARSRNHEYTFSGQLYIGPCSGPMCRWAFIGLWVGPLVPARRVRIFTFMVSELSFQRVDLALSEPAPGCYSRWPGVVGILTGNVFERRVVCARPLSC